MVKSTKPRLLHSFANAATSKSEPVSPEGTQERNKYNCDLAATRLQPLLTANPEGTQAVKTQDTGPDSPAAYPRKDFRESRLCIFPEKSTKLFEMSGFL